MARDDGSPPNRRGSRPQYRQRVAHRLLAPLLLISLLLLGAETSPVVAQELAAAADGGAEQPAATSPPPPTTAATSPPQPPAPAAPNSAVPAASTNPTSPEPDPPGGTPSPAPASSAPGDTAPVPAPPSPSPSPSPPPSPLPGPSQPASPLAPPQPSPAASPSLLLTVSPTLGLLSLPACYVRHRTAPNAAPQYHGVGGTSRRRTAVNAVPPGRLQPLLWHAYCAQVPLSCQHHHLLAMPQAEPAPAPAPAPAGQPDQLSLVLSLVGSGLTPWSQTKASQTLAAITEVLGAAGIPTTGSNALLVGVQGAGAAGAAPQRALWWQRPALMWRRCRPCTATYRQLCFKLWWRHQPMHRLPRRQRWRPPRPAASWLRSCDCRVGAAPGQHSDPVLVLLQCALTGCGPTIVFPRAASCLQACQSARPLCLPCILAQRHPLPTSSPWVRPAAR